MPLASPLQFPLGTNAFSLALDMQFKNFQLLILTLSLSVFAETYPSGNSIKQNLKKDLNQAGYGTTPKIDNLTEGESLTNKDVPDADGLHNGGYNDRAGKAFESYLLEQHGYSQSKAMAIEMQQDAIALDNVTTVASPAEKKAAQILKDYSKNEGEQMGKFAAAKEKNNAQCKLLRRPFNQGKEGVDGQNDWVGCEESTIEPKFTETETFFSDTMLTKLKESGVDTYTLKYRLDRGDMEGAKQVLETVDRQGRSISEAEEELAELAARRIRLGKYGKALRGHGYQNNPDGSHLASDDDSPGDSGNGSEGADGGEGAGGDGGGADENRVRLIRKSTSVSQLPGYRYGDERTFIGSPKQRGMEVSYVDPNSQRVQMEMDTQENYDVVQLKERGVRKLIPGMNIFRFAHHRFAELESKDQLQTKLK